MRNGSQLSVDGVSCGHALRFAEYGHPIPDFRVDEEPQTIAVVLMSG
jgi:hypothetical protein